VKLAKRLRLLRLVHRSAPSVRGLRVINPE
jgi:hypothetical protein